MRDSRLGGRMPAGVSAEESRPCARRSCCRARPVLSDLDALDGIQTYHRTGVFRAFLVSRSARRVLLASASE